MRERVVITGLGVVSAAGADVPASWRALERALRPATIPCPFGPFPRPVPLFAAAGDESEAERAAPDRTFRLARRAAAEALADAGLERLPSSFRLGVCLGTTVACQLNDIAFYAAYRASGNPPLAAADRFAAGSLSERLARVLRADGPVLTVVNACTSGTDAAGVALEWLRADLCDAVLAGGADELSAIPVSGFFALGLTSPEPCRPFDRDRQGLTLGEGAGIAVLEREESALRRGRPVALLAAGFGSAADGHHLTAPHPEGRGLECAIRGALADAGIDPDAVDFVNAHGTATPDNDRIEGAVLARLFGEGVRVASTKGYTGHALGAAGGIETVFTALALRHGRVPANVGFATRDAAIPFAPLTAATPVSRPFALSTALAFGGNNAALVLARAGETP